MVYTEFRTFQFLNTVKFIRTSPVRPGPSLKAWDSAFNRSKFKVHLRKVAAVVIGSLAALDSPAL